MKNKIIMSFIIFITLFLTISVISANENVTEIVSLDENSTYDTLQEEIHDTPGVNQSETEISSSDMVSYKDYEDTFSVKLTSNGTPLNNKKVQFVLNKVTYDKTTDKDGIASINFKLKTGKYTVSYSFLGDDNYASSKDTSTITVKSDLVTKLKIADKDINYREGSKTIFQIKLVDIYNKAVSGKTVKVTVNGKTYSAKTNSKGIATFHIKFKKGTQTIKASFSKSGKYVESSKTFKINVKSKLEKGNGYWVNKWDMKKVNLKKLKKLGTKHILLQHTVFDKYGKTTVLNWIKKAHKYGMQVHMWMAVFYKNGKYYPPSNKKGTYNYKKMNEIIKKAKKYASYDGVDGIHFDYIRFSGNAYKYKNSAAAVNYFAKKASVELHKINSDCIVSAAVMPEPNDNKYYYGQDIPTMSKYMDAIIPMIYKGNYHASSKWIKKTTNKFIKQSNGAKIWSGLQSYKSDSNLKKLSYKSLFNDAKNAKKGGAAGVIMFRWGLSALLNFNKL